MNDPEIAMAVESIWEMLELVGPEKRTDVLFGVIGRLYQQQAESCVTMPFGKYKGCPISEALTDRGYMQWLSTQTWVRMKHPWVAEALKKGGNLNQDLAYPPQ